MEAGRRRPLLPGRPVCHLPDTALTIWRHGRQHRCASGAHTTRRATRSLPPHPRHAAARAAGVLELLALTSWGAGAPIAYKTALASAAGSLWRVGITPLDTLKTTLQVEGPAAYAQLRAKVQREGPTVLYQVSHGLDQLT